MDDGSRSLDDDISAYGLRVGIVAARFNDSIVDSLLTAAVDTFVTHGADAANIKTVRVPGAFEIPVAMKKMAASRNFDALVALGCVIRGATPHFDYVAGEVSRGVADVCFDYEIALGFGVLTVDTLEQASERSGANADNKGVDAALAAIQMASVLRQLEP